MNSHERPKDPRYEKSLEHTRDKFHDEACLYHRSPAEMLALMEKKEKKEAETKAKAAAEKESKAKAKPTPSYDGMSPATAH